MNLQIELRCIQFPFIIFQMSLELDWSPPVANSIVWTWFGRKHTCLEKVPQLTVSKQKVQGTGRWSPEFELWRGIYLGRGIQVFLECWNLLPRLCLELDVQPKWTTGQGPWSGRWPRTQWPLWQNYSVPWLTTCQRDKSLQHFTNLGFMGEWPNRSHSWEKGTWQHA